MATALDLTGLRCPLPVIRLEAAMRKALPGDVMIAKADDPLAKVDIPHAARSAGFQCEIDPESSESVFVFRIAAPQE
ncbi:MAG: sulfurtransferase TusA family protein [Pseudomonadota bacterium]